MFLKKCILGATYCALVKIITKLFTWDWNEPINWRRYFLTTSSLCRWPSLKECVQHSMFHIYQSLLWKHTCICCSFSIWIFVIILYHTNFVLSLLIFQRDIHWQLIVSLLQKTLFYHSCWQWIKLVIQSWWIICNSTFDLNLIKNDLHNDILLSLNLCWFERIGKLGKKSSIICTFTTSHIPQVLVLWLGRISRKLFLIRS